MLAIIVHGRIQAPSTLVTIQEHDLDAGVRRNLYKESSRQESPRPQAFAAIGTEAVRSILGGYRYTRRPCPPTQERSGGSQAQSDGARVLQASMQQGTWR